MATPRTILTAVALTGVLAGPATAMAGPGQSAQYLPTLKAPATSPVAIHGTSAKAYLHSGDKLDRAHSLMRVKVSTPAHKGLQLKLTCPKGFVSGYGYKGPDALAVNGKRTLSQHTVRPKVQAATDLNHDGRFTGTVYALCEG
ncbi:MAG: hypothetical protein QOH43_4177 [Solirubrobacteraceae bacterium]|jgi:hypothetical protein|nr:hypothetical protein [Solirubrobacteraceae bacterium]